MASTSGSEVVSEKVGTEQSRRSCDLAFRFRQKSTTLTSSTSRRFRETLILSQEDRCEPGDENGSHRKRVYSICTGRTCYGIVGVVDKQFNRGLYRRTTKLCNVRRCVKNGNRMKTVRGVTYVQSGQGQVWVHLNSVGIDGRARRNDR